MPTPEQEIHRSGISFSLAFDTTHDDFSKITITSDRLTGNLTCDVVLPSNAPLYRIREILTNALIETAGPIKELSRVY